MKRACPHCGQVLELSGSTLSVCTFCGQPFAESPSTSTVDFTPGADEEPLAERGMESSTEMPKVLGPYRLLRPLGRGGMGSVFEAEEAGSGRHVAIKMLAPGSRLTAESLQRFRQEGRLASAIAHPRCVFILAVGEDAGRPYIVMELMPGSTLKDLVDTEGPLSPEQAVTMMLDVIEGVQQAHQLGLIHRDIKPSNCFLAVDGRVKIGDFGLAKSLERDPHLTETGAFLGTPLFASPEQIRKDPLDHQTDVYSAAATLFYLLTGRAPFQSNDAAATMARIVADPVPSMRTLRPEVPLALDRAVRRGLERNRARRWRDLAEFREALLPILPSHLSIAGMGLRLAAYLLDSLLIALGSVLLSVIAFLSSASDSLAKNPAAHAPDTSAVIEFTGLAAGCLYFIVLEGRWGCSLGKRWLRLRVCTLEGYETPGLARAFVRAVVWFVLVNLGGQYMEFVHFGDDPEGLKRNAAGFGCWIVGLGLALSTMRAGSGYRGLHEYLSGTRVIQLPWPARRRSLRARDVHGPLWSLEQLADLPPKIGPYTVQGVVTWGPSHRILDALDPRLDRSVWIWLRPRECAPVPLSRRERQEVTRLRWLASGHEGTDQWDAFLAPSGQPLQRIVEDLRRLEWSEARDVLDELSQELARSLQDETVPDALNLDQVWIDANGHVQLLDFPCQQGHTKPAEEPVQSQSQRGLTLLHRVATLALEGQPRSPGDTAPQIRAPIPLHAGRILSRLHDGAQAYETIDHFRGALRASRDRMTAISRQRRLFEILVKGFTGYLAFSLAVFSAFAVFEMSRWLPDWLNPGKNAVYVLGGLFVVATVLCVFIFKGGLWLRVFDMAVVDSRGQPASRSRCAWRTTLMWLVTLVPLGLTWGLFYGVRFVVPKVGFLEYLLPVASIAAGSLLSLVAPIAFALWSPSRSLHDRLAGTYLVPR